MQKIKDSKAQIKVLDVYKDAECSRDKRTIKIQKIKDVQKNSTK